MHYMCSKKRLTFAGIIVAIALLASGYQNLNQAAGKFALLTRQELAYLSGGLPQLTNVQKSNSTTKIKQKLQIFEMWELPLLMGPGFRTRVGFTISRE
jgi:hypothetical protein